MLCSVCGELADYQFDVVDQVLELVVDEGSSCELAGSLDLPALGREGRPERPEGCLWHLEKHISSQRLICPETCGWQRCQAISTLHRRPLRRGNVRITGREQIRWSCPLSVIGGAMPDGTPVTPAVTSIGSSSSGAAGHLLLKLLGEQRERAAAPDAGVR